MNQLTVSKEAIEEIVFFEVTSEEHYKAFLTHPVVPNLYSGITIGIGYDLGYHTEDEIRTDWPAYPQFIKVAKLIGSNAREALGLVKETQVHYEDAFNVFENVSLQVTAKGLVITFPDIQLLRPDAIGAMMSLCYNRGFSLSGSRRREMYMIKQVIPKQDYHQISTLILSMCRLWDGSLGANTKEEGLVRRRVREAAMVLKTNDYQPQDLVNITF